MREPQKSSSLLVCPGSWGHLSEALGFLLLLYISWYPLKVWNSQVVGSQVQNSKSMPKLVCFWKKYFCIYFFSSCPEFRGLWYISGCLSADVCYYLLIWQCTWQCLFNFQCLPVFLHDIDLPCEMLRGPCLCFSTLLIYSTEYFRIEIS